MQRGTILAPLTLALLAGLGAGLTACGPTAPTGDEGPPGSPAEASPAKSTNEEPTLILPTVKPGSTERPILTLEPPPIVEP